MENYTTEDYVTSFDGNVYLENEVPQDVCCITFSTCFLMRNHTGELM
jgi:hypothetical protein